jgi:hypothetical protein
MELVHAKLRYRKKRYKKNRYKNNRYKKNRYEQADEGASFPLFLLPPLPAPILLVPFIPVPFPIRILVKLIQYVDPARSDDPVRLGLVDGDDVFDLTSCAPHPVSVHHLYYSCGGRSSGLESAVKEIRSRSDCESGPGWETLRNNVSDRERPSLLSPVTPAGEAVHNLRIWLAGVTHEDSAKLREIEAKQSTGQTVNVYDQKYRECAAGGIPELFEKGDPRSVVGHGEGITYAPGTIRLVPEIELVSVYGLNVDGQVELLGYTGGNDYTDNGIEAQNPLNLPQAKNWHGGCASLGPVLITPSEFDDSDIEVTCKIIRDGQEIAAKSGRTGQANLNMQEGRFHLERSLFERLPLLENELQVLYWGTPIVFGEVDLKDGLQVGDRVQMSFSGGIGEVENPIVPFPENSQLEALSASRTS